MIVHGTHNNTVILLLVVGILCIAFLLPIFVYAEKTVVITAISGSKMQGCEIDGCYDPVDLTTEVGTIVIMKNNDDAVHSFTSDKFNSQLLVGNMEYSWVVEPGTVTYHCAMHPWAVGTITGIYVPTLDSLTYYPDWVVLLFDWYDEGKIDYVTLINAIQYLIYNGIIE